MKKQYLIFKILNEKGFVFMSNSGSILSIHLDLTFNGKERFLFILNSQPVISTKNEWYAKMQLDSFIEQGFKLDESL